MAMTTGKTELALELLRSNRGRRNSAQVIRQVVRSGNLQVAKYLVENKVDLFKKLKYDEDEDAEENKDPNFTAFAYLTKLISQQKWRGEGKHADRVKLWEYLYEIQKEKALEGRSTSKDPSVSKSAADPLSVKSESTFCVAEAVSSCLGGLLPGLSGTANGPLVDILTAMLATAKLNQRESMFEVLCVKDIADALIEIPKLVIESTAAKMQWIIDGPWGIYEAKALVDEFPAEHGWAAYAGPGNSQIVIHTQTGSSIIYGTNPDEIAILATVVELTTIRIHKPLTQNEVLRLANCEKNPFVFTLWLTGDAAYRNAIFGSDSKLKEWKSINRDPAGKEKLAAKKHK
eukprot:CAMPEP_0184657026 /NCGR_PEP_ID=MMETSP0308-20130426/16917_1 /TAXON_ID=38269 /ORGANISM="Gloeochaete witrockiana, Strain SAG 46.84" /LENGTH=344 /DNA_ID=CAMNT_0027094391 /DNA_START=237 /DNA_END=1271 /DNA_ORIENTATION=-